MDGGSGSMNLGRYRIWVAGAAVAFVLGLMATHGSKPVPAAIPVAAHASSAVTPTAIPAIGTPTFAALGSDATRTLTNTWYVGDGRWRTCALASCSTTRQDWGADSLAGALYLRWTATHDPRLGTFFHRLALNLPRHVACTGRGCRAWSDVPEWD